MDPHSPHVHVRAHAHACAHAQDTTPSAQFAASAEQHAKLDALRGALSALPALAVSFSGGVDSTFLLAVAQEQLGARVIAVTETNALYPERETAGATSFCEERGVDQVLLRHDPESVEGFAHNPKNRCYLCKRDLFAHLQQAADARALERGLIAPGEHIPCAEGSNLSDLSDYRPGAQAVRECGVLSPLQDAGLTKQDIRDLSREMGVPTWDKPSFACLASRFVYGEAITNPLLERVDKAEQLLIDAGFAQVRVRMHDGGSMARVEVPAERLVDAFAFLTSEGSRRLHALGFAHVSLDIDGYRTGSMNE